MDIEEFYDENERRRQSAEFEFGDGWTDARGRVHELSWVETTGELYIMGPPREKMNQDVNADGATDDGEYPALAITVLGVVTSHDDVEATLAGWESAMESPNSVEWLRAKFPTEIA